MVLLWHVKNYVAVKHSVETTVTKTKLQLIGFYSLWTSFGISGKEQSNALHKNKFRMHLLKTLLQT